MEIPENHQEFCKAVARVLNNMESRVSEALIGLIFGMTGSIL